MTDIHVTTVDGLAVVAPLTDLPDQESPSVREGLVRRRICETGGTCPCGARRPLLNRAQRREAARSKRAVSVAVADIRHDPACPAVSPEVMRWVKEHR